MQTAQHSHDLNMPSPRSILIMSALCLNMFLVACDKNEPVQQAETPKSIEVIPQDLVAVQSGNSVQKLHSPALFVQSIKAAYKHRSLLLLPA